MLPPQLHNISSGVERPSNFDILIGRGSVINDHVGNLMFRDLISQMNKTSYPPLKRERTMIAKSVVAHVRSLNGRFLERDRSCNLWFDVGDKRAIEKTERSLCDSAKVKKAKKTQMIPLIKTSISTNFISSKPQFINAIRKDCESSSYNFKYIVPDYDPLLIPIHTSETKESSLEYFKELQTRKHLYKDEFHFLENIFGVGYSNVYRIE